jgi:hypothetical protein
MIEKRSSKTYFAILFFSVLFCMPSALAAESGAYLNNPSYPSHPYLDRIPIYSGPSATQDGQNNNSIAILPVPTTPTIPQIMNQRSSPKIAHNYILKENISRPMNLDAQPYSNSYVFPWLINGLSTRFSNFIGNVF